MMDYHELINELSYEDNPYVLDYIDAAIEMLEHLYSELKAANARCETLSKMVTQYQDELIPGSRERAEKAEAQLSQYTASGLEPCDYTAMRSAIDGEKEARQSLSETLRALEKSNARAEKAERERDALKARYRGGEPCEVCLHRDPNIADCNGDCLACSLDCLCNTCCEYSNWEYDEWRED